MDDKAEAARAAGEAHGSEAAELCAAQVSARGVPDTDEAYVAVLGCCIGKAARELEVWGMPDHLVQVWIDAAVKAGVVRLRELSQVLSQPKRSEH
jgi:hypothetical protein